MGKTDPNRATKQAREIRSVRVAELYRKGHSMRQIRDAVMDEFNLDSYSLSTVKKDIDKLLQEALKARIKDTDLAIQMELDRIDDQLRELWEAWNKSKTDQKLKSQKQSGTAVKEPGGKAIDPKGNIQDQDAKTTIKTTSIEKSEKDEINYGDPRYQDLINKLGMERRKLLGLYAAEKKEITGKDGSPVFKGFDAFMAECLDIADNDKETNEATQQKAINSAG